MYLLRIIKPKIKFDKYIDNNIFIPIWKELKIIVPIVFIINKGFGKNVKASNLFASSELITLSLYASFINLALLGNPLNSESIIMYEEFGFILNKKVNSFDIIILIL